MKIKERIINELTSYNGTLGLVYDDLKGDTIFLNENEQFEMASAIKVFIMLAAFEKEIENDELTLKEKDICEGSGILKDLTINRSYKIIDLITLMIIVSDNTATNAIIDLLGVEYINKIIKKYGFNKTILHNRIDFDKYRVLGTSTPLEYATFYKKLLNLEFKGSAMMIEILKKQHYRSMITKELPVYYLSGDDSYALEEEQIKIASKSGSMNSCRNDGGIVFTSKGAYIIILLNKDFYDKVYYDNHDAIRYGAKISRLIFDYFIH